MSEEKEVQPEIEVKHGDMLEEVVEVHGDEPKQKKASTLDLGGLEFYYENHKKAINYGATALVVIIGLFCAYKFYWLPNQEKEAQNEAFFAQTYFEKDSFNIALNGNKLVRTADGDKTMLGFTELADSYSATKTGNLANYYAGICYLRLGKFQEAIESLEKYSGDDEMVAPMAIGAIGDAHMELNQADEAIKYYEKAADKSLNGFTTPMFLKKAAFALETKGNYAESLTYYERIKNEYPRSTEGRDVEKYIARVKTSGNLK